MLYCLPLCLLRSLFFFFNDTATTEIYTLSLHDALPISRSSASRCCSTSPMRAQRSTRRRALRWRTAASPAAQATRSEEHTSELQSRLHLVCRLLLEKKKKHAQSSRILSHAPLRHSLSRL